MSSRAAARGKAAANSIRLTSRTSKAVATSRASPSRCFLFCRGSRAARSAPIAVATVAIPPTHKPPQARRSSPITERSSAPGNLMGGKEIEPGSLVLAYDREYEAWYEAIVVQVLGSAYRVRFRDYPEEGVLMRRRETVALLYVPEPEPTPQAGQRSAAQRRMGARADDLDPAQERAAGPQQRSRVGRLPRGPANHRS